MVFGRKPDPKLHSINTPGGRTAGSTPLNEAQGGSSDADGDDLSVIGSDLLIEGQAITIRCKGLLRVNGNIQANVHSKELTVGKTGEVTGTIAADTVHVHGRVSGAIHGTTVILHATADVEGDIHSRTLGIEQGAGFDGRSRKVKDEAELAPQLEPGGRVHPLHS
jgi:cytoskeletal protein CcmA (bactofilin family)